MGELTRNFNWTQTSVGDPEYWPQSLRTVVAMILSSRFPMFLWWGEDLIQFYNDAYRPSLGNEGKHPAALGQKAIDCWPEIWDIIYPLIRQVLLTGEATWSEDQLVPIYRNGKIEDVYWTFGYSPIISESEKIEGVLVVCTETTGKVESLREQALARKKIEESEQQVRSLVESAPFPIGVYTGKEMRIELANQAMLDVWGKGKEVMGKLFAKVLPELENQAIFEQLDRVFTTGKPFHARNHRVDIEVGGKLAAYYFNYSLIALYDAEGIVYGVMNTGADVTDLNLAKQKVEENEKNFRNTILKAPVAMCIFRGLRHVVEIANDRMIELWGKAAFEVLDKPIFEGLPEAKDQGFELLLDNVLKTGKAFVAQDIPITLPRNGKIERVYVNFLYEPYREANGTISGIIAVATDVTAQVIARRKIEEVVAERTKELAKANGNLQRSNAELAQFAYIASHDLQEPIRKVSTFAQMLENRLKDIDPVSKNYLDRINISIARMLTLIRDVLSYSELSKQHEVFEPVDLQEIMDGIRSDFELLIEQKNAEIHYEALPTIQAIPLQMSQLFRNLVSNALKFTRKDGKPVITIRAVRGSDAEAAVRFIPGAGTSYYNIEIRDNGIGFKQAYAEQIFSIFQRLHIKTEYPGTGIGLAMCKKIVQNHHGDIYATGDPGTGAVFHVILPEKQVLVVDN
jgi:PAS domain S-box-containing protein